MSIATWVRGGGGGGGGHFIIFQIGHYFMGETKSWFIRAKPPWFSGKRSMKNSSNWPQRLPLGPQLECIRGRRHVPVRSQERDGSFGRSLGKNSRQKQEKQWRIQGGGGGPNRLRPPFFSADFSFLFLFTPEVGLVGGRYTPTPCIM